MTQVRAQPTGEPRHNPQLGLRFEQIARQRFDARSQHIVGRPQASDQSAAPAHAAIVVEREHFVAVRIELVEAASDLFRQGAKSGGLDRAAGIARS
ncbi:MAG: hypothetical protein ACXW3N_14085 [Rhodoplanes sp.]